MNDKSMPLVSVIMGVYNDERFLEKAISSILNQSYLSLELIICNDCSSDSSKDIILKYKAMDDRIVYLENEKNMGLANSLNKCLQYAKGDFVARMDSDDISLKNRFEVQVNYLIENEEIAVISSNAYYIDNHDIRYKQTRINTVKEIVLQDALRKTCLIHPTVMMRRGAILDVGGYTVNRLTQRAEDYDLWCKLLVKGYRLQVIPNLLLEYREDISGIQKRKYKFRIQEAKLKYKWMKKCKVRPREYMYAIRPLIIGLVPKRIYRYLHARV